MSGAYGSLPMRWWLPEMTFASRSSPGNREGTNHGWYPLPTTLSEHHLSHGWYWSQHPTKSRSSPNFASAIKVSSIDLRVCPCSWSIFGKSLTILVLRTLVRKWSVAKRMKFGMQFDNCLLTNFRQCGDNLGGGYTNELLLFSHHVDKKNDILDVKDPASNIGYGLMSHWCLYNVLCTYHISPVL